MTLVFGKVLCPDEVAEDALGQGIVVGDVAGVRYVVNTAFAFFCVSAMVVFVVVEGGQKEHRHKYRR